MDKSFIIKTAVFYKKYCMNQHFLFKGDLNSYVNTIFKMYFRIKQ